MGALAQSLRSYWLGEKFSRDPALASYFGYGPTASGTTISEWTAMNYSAWWAAVQLISNAIAAFPLGLYRKMPGGGREQFESHPLHWILHTQFNANETSFGARRRMVMHLLCWGNAYAEIERDASNRPMAIWPLSPERVSPDYRRDGSLYYRVIQPSTGLEVQIDAADMLHIKGLAHDELMGYSVVRQARETIGNGLAMERYGGQFFGNGAVSSLVAKHPSKLSEQALKHLKASISESIGGDRKHSVLVLEENMAVEKISIPPDDAQFLESRQFNVLEVARWFNLPAHKLGNLERATFSNIEEQNRDYLNDCLQPLIINAEQEYDRKLVRPLEAGIQYTKHNVDALLRPRSLERAQVLEIKMRNGALSADEWRELDEQNPLPKGQGKLYLVPLNMVPADRVHDVIDKQVEPEPKPAPAAEPSPEPDPERAAKEIAADHAVIVGLMRRMVHKEGQAARRAAKKGTPSILKWIQDFYPKHMATMKDVLLPNVTAHLIRIGSQEDPKAVTNRLVGEYIQSSLDELSDRFKHCPEAETENSMDILITRWEAQRPEIMADALMTEEIKYAVQQ